MTDALRDRVGQVAQLPFHDGDGYSWGGDIIVSFGERAISFGSSQSFSERQDILALARLIAASPCLLAAAKKALNFIENTESEMGEKLDSGDALRDAIHKATGAA